MEQTISVIVPVFNCKSYLKKCVESILNQTYPHILLVLVDDGSSDGSGEICDSFASQDSRIQVIHQNNLGVSAARNTGLDAATGSWILFVDSDDYLKHDYCQRMLNASVQCDTDVTIARPFFRSQPDVQCYDVAQIERLKQACLSYDEEKFDYNVDAPWGKLFRRSLIEMHNIRFPEFLSRSEDAFFCASVYEHTNRICCLNWFGYVHVERGGSLCRSFIPDAPKMLERILCENQKWVQKYHPEEADYENALWYRVLPGIDECEKTFFLHEANTWSHWEIMQHYSKFINSGLVSHAIRVLKPKDVLKRQYRIRLLMYKIHLSWLFILIKTLTQISRTN